MTYRMAIAILAAVLLWSPLASAESPKLQKAISAVLKQKDVNASKVGIYVVDIESGEQIYGYHEEDLFNPASNTKLITAATALTRFGPSHTFATRISAESVKDGIIQGAIYLKGDGDPNLLYEDMVKWAIAIKRMGITKVEGDVLVDDTTFDPGYMPPGFDQKQEDASYRAPIGAVSVNFNYVAVTVEPGDSGQAKISLYPPNDHVVIENKAKTIKGKRQRISVKSVTTDAGTTIQVFGAIGMKASAGTWRKRIDNPSLFAGSVFKAALEDVGITVTGKVDKATRPSNTVSLVLHDSKPLLYHLMLMNKWSNNFIAEQVFRLLGEKDDKVTTGQSYEAVDAMLSAAGVSGKYKVMNGSGLYTGNEFSPKQIGAVLRYMANHKYGPEFAASLPISGEDGTLRKRLGDPNSAGQLRGKTGTLNEVTALAGYTKSKSGKQLAYVILFNDTPVKAWTLRNQQDQIARAIAQNAP